MAPLWDAIALGVAGIAAAPGARSALQQALARVTRALGAADGALFVHHASVQTPYVSSGLRAVDVNEAAFSMDVPISDPAVGLWGRLRFRSLNSVVHWGHDAMARLEHFGEMLRMHLTETGASTPGVLAAVDGLIQRASSSGTLSHPALTIAPDGRVHRASTAFRELYGRPVHHLTDAVTHEEYRQTIAAAVAEGRAWTGRIPLRGRMVRWHVTPLQPAGTLHGAVCWVTETMGPAAMPDSGVEEALVKASRLLVAETPGDLNALPEIVGTATGAQYAFLMVLPTERIARLRDEKAASAADDAVPLESYVQYEWGHPSGEPPPGAMFAVPILTAEGHMLGYLGIEHGPGHSAYRSRDARLLNVLGDLLCTSLQRRAANRALRRSQQRYQQFVDATSEAILRIGLTRPLSLRKASEAQIDHVLRAGYVAECNTAAARLLNYKSAQALTGRALSDLLTDNSRKILEKAVAAQFRLQGYEHVMEQLEAPHRHFVINTVGVAEEEVLHDIWVGSTEVTDRVHMEQRMVTAVERHHRRIGRALHDRIGQQLAGTRMLLQNIGERHFEPATDGYHAIQRVSNHLQTSIVHVNDLQRGVLPMQVERDGLAHALRDLATRCNQERDAVTCCYMHDGSAEVTDDYAKMQLYRIAQEALRNARLHSEATCIEVVFRRTDDGRLLLRIADNGDGFDPRAASDGLGLHSIRYRARAIGGQLNITSSRRNGTTVACTWRPSAVESV
ncbi:sensor histidine kinase [Salisaeta longa]|uniref:sensor histidine kinase n=1 Tax=Salisaeta longa TaxID=503170 RepID=UPI0003B41408|nr:ATP-binding protein [Salisaeta longa]